LALFSSLLFIRLSQLMEGLLTRLVVLMAQWAGATVFGVVLTPSEADLYVISPLIPFLSLLTPLQISRNNTELEALVKLKSTLDPTNKDFYSHGLMMVTPAVAYLRVWLATSMVKWLTFHCSEKDYLVQYLLQWKLRECPICTCIIIY